MTYAEKYPLPEGFWWREPTAFDMGRASVNREYNERSYVWTWTDENGRLTVRTRHGSSSCHLAHVKSLDEACAFMSAYMMMGLYNEQVS